MTFRYIATFLIVTSSLSTFSQTWSGTTPGDIYYSQGNVGVGISTPEQKFHVNGNAKVTGTFFVEGDITGDGILNLKPSTPTVGVLVREYNSSDYGNMQVTDVGFGFSYNSTASLQAYINPAGNFVVANNITGANVLNLKPSNATAGVVIREYNSNDYGNLQVTDAGFGLSYNTTASPQVYINPAGNFIIKGKIQGENGFLDVKPTTNVNGVIIRKFDDDSNWGNLEVTNNGFGLSYNNSDPQVLVNAAGNLLLKQKIEGINGFIDIKPTGTNFGMLIRKHDDDSKWGNLRVTTAGFGLAYNANDPQAYVNTTGDFVIKNQLMGTNGYVNIKPTVSSHGLLIREYNSNDWGNLKVTDNGFGLAYLSNEPQVYVNTSGNLVLTNRIESSKGYVDIQPTMGNFGAMIRKFDDVSKWGNLKVSSNGFGISYLSNEPQVYVNASGNLVLTNRIESSKGYVDIQPTMGNFGAMIRKFDDVSKWGNLKVSSNGFGISYLSNEPQVYVNASGNFILTNRIESSKGYVDIQPTLGDFGAMIRKFDDISKWGNLKVTEYGFGLAYMANDPQAWVDINGDFHVKNDLVIEGNIQLGGTGSSLWTQNGSDIHYSTGKVGINTSTIPTDYQFAVAGKAIAEEVKIQLVEDWPDFVFESDYPLTSLHETKKYIEEHHHLPEIPSAPEVKENGGIELGEMNALLLKKIEELTLHLIKKEEEIDELRNRIEKLENIE